MHVKEQVREFVHDVKRKFSKKHKRESTCSTCDSHDGASTYSSAGTLGTLEDSSSSSAASSRPGTPERGRFGSLLHPRISPKKHNDNVLHKARRLDGKRYRLFSAPSIPSSRVASSSVSGHRQTATEPSSTPKGSVWMTKSMQDAPDATSPPVVRDYPDVIDITSSVVGESVLRDSSCQISSYSENSGTLVDPKKSVSDSDWRFDSVDLHSDVNSAPILSFAPSLDQMAQSHDLPPLPPPKSEQAVSPDTFRHEEITLAPSVSSPSPRPANLDKSTVEPSPSTPVVSQTSPAILPAQPIGSTSASPAPVYIPRLTAPSMFLPIPNTDPLSALLTKYVPAEQRPRRDVAGEYADRDIHEMVMSNSWRALAKMARDRIVASDPEDLGRILDLWSLRLSTLARLRLTNHASAECTNLFAVLNAVTPSSVPGSFPGSGIPPPVPVPVPSSPAPSPSIPLSPSGLTSLAQLPGTPSQKPFALPTGTSPTTAPRKTPELLHPFELTVFHARVHYWSGDPLGYVDALSQILGQCKERAREEARIVMQRRALGGMGAREGGDVEAKEEEGSGKEVGEDADTEDGEDAGKEDADTDTEDDEDGEDADTKAQDEAEEQDDNTSQSEGVSESEETNEEEREDKGGADEEGSVATEVQDDALVAAEANLSMWLERVARVCLILASHLIEMNDYQAAINLLAPLCTRRTAPSFQPAPSPELHSALARIYLLSGNLSKAEEHFSIAASAAENVESDAIVMNTALMAAASGDWTHAEEALADIVAKQPGNFTAVNNLAVTLLCQGRIKQGIDLLEGALRTSPSSVVVAEPFLFNLSTMYELRSTAAIDKKRELLIEVAKWSGDGLKTSCLKMPSS